MHITEEHFFHGTALIQIAEHPQFTAINSLRVNGSVSRSAYKINDSIAVFLKYATRPKGRFREFQFTFTNSQLMEIAAIKTAGNELFVALVCGQAKEICCIPNTLLQEMIEERKTDVGAVEDQYQILVTLKPSEAFRVYMNKPGRRKIILGKERKVARNRFPNALFT